MAKNSFNDMIVRAMQKRDASRVALKKSGCGAVMIDGLTFSVSAESDGAASSKGVMFTLSGEAADSGELTLDMIDVTYPAGAGVKTIRRKAELFERKDGGKVWRAKFSEIKIPQCAESNIFAEGALTEDELRGGMNKQIIFKFVPKFSGAGEPEVMLNIYPIENPLDGNFAEWVTLTADQDFFEHGGLSKIMNRKRK